VTQVRGADDATTRTPLRSRGSRCYRPSSGASGPSGSTSRSCAPLSACAAGRGNEDLTRRLDELERKYDGTTSSSRRLRRDRALMTPPEVRGSGSASRRTAGASDRARPIRHQPRDKAARPSLRGWVEIPTVEGLHHVGERRAQASVLLASEEIACAESGAQALHDSPSLLVRHRCDRPAETSLVATR